MNTSKPVLVVGPVRNCSKTLRDDVLRIRQALQDYETHWFLIESDSSDDSVKVLESLFKEIPNFQFITYGNLEPHHPKRTVRLAIVRNRYVQEAKNRDVDYVVAADFDGINNAISVEAIRSCQERDDWDVVCGNQDGPYYDVWALRAKGWLEHDVWVVADNLRANGMNLEDAMKQEVYPYMRRVPLDSEWIEVESAYSGFTIYKKEALISGEHIPLYPDGREQCELVPFNQAIREAGYRIFINPRLVNGGLNEHTRGLV